MRMFMKQIQYLKKSESKILWERLPFNYSVFFELLSSLFIIIFPVTHNPYLLVFGLLLPFPSNYCLPPSF